MVQNGLKLPSKRWMVLLVLSIAPALLDVRVVAQEADEKTFTTPSEASKALYDAAKEGDPTMLLAVLGPSAKSLISSGDSVEDRKNVDDFVRRYEQMNRWGRDITGGRTLYLGVENWPFSIPLKQAAGGQWYFDAKAGADEILYRRIGNNELAAIRICGVLAQAQSDYFRELHDGDNVHQYAQKFLSDSGKHNGLYWQTAAGETDSPIGPLIAFATGEGYKDRNASFHGYFFRVLTSQGPQASGGAKSYVIDGKMTKGFAFLAYPAEHRNSGVMTFLVDSKGTIYEKDLGPHTGDSASAMKAFNPDSTWRPVSSLVEDEANTIP